jgi:N-acetylneuraminate lyase
MDQLFVPAFATGCFAGCIGTTQNIIPKHFVRMYEAMKSNDFATAARLQAEANRVVEVMVENENWSFRKAMVRYLGMDLGAARPPYEPLTEELYAAFSEKIRKQGIVCEKDAAQVR